MAQFLITTMALIRLWVVVVRGPLIRAEIAMKTQIPMQAEMKAEIPIHADVTADILPVAARMGAETSPITEILPLKAEIPPMRAEMVAEMLPVAAEMRAEISPMGTEILPITEILPLKEEITLKADMKAGILPVTAEMETEISTITEISPLKAEIGLRAEVPIKEFLSMTADILPTRADKHSTHETPPAFRNLFRVEKERSPRDAPALKSRRETGSRVTPKSSIRGHRSDLSSSTAMTISPSSEDNDSSGFKFQSDSNLPSLTSSGYVTSAVSPAATSSGARGPRSPKIPPKLTSSLSSLLPFDDTRSSRSHNRHRTTSMLLGIFGPSARYHQRQTTKTPGTIGTEVSRVQQETTAFRTAVSSSGIFSSSSAVPTSSSVVFSSSPSAFLFPSSSAFGPGDFRHQKNQQSVSRKQNKDTNQDAKDASGGAKDSFHSTTQEPLVSSANCSPLINYNFEGVANTTSIDNLTYQLENSSQIWNHLKESTRNPLNSNQSWNPLNSTPWNSLNSNQTWNPQNATQNWNNLNSTQIWNLENSTQSDFNKISCPYSPTAPLAWSQVTMDREMICVVNPHWLTFDPPPHLSHMIITVVYSILMTVGVFGNGLVIYLFISSRALRTPSNLFILNLAISDFFLMFNIVLIIPNSLHQGPITGRIGCDVYGFVGGLTGTTSIMTLAAISLDRYLVISYPLDPFKRLSRVQVIIMILVTWAYSFIFSLVPLLGIKNIRYSPEGLLTTCSFDYLSEAFNNRIYIFTFFIAAWVIPINVISFSYLSIVTTVSKQEKYCDTYQGNFANSFKHQSLRKKKSVELRLAKVASGIMGLWVAAWTPYAIVALLGIFGHKALVTPLISMVPAIFCKTAACLDPFVYALSHPRFKNELRKRVCRRRPKFLSGMRNGMVHGLSISTFSEIREERELSEAQVYDTTEPSFSSGGPLLHRNSSFSSNPALVSEKLRRRDTLSSPSSRSLVSPTSEIYPRNASSFRRTRKSRQEEVRVCYSTYRQLRTTALIEFPPKVVVEPSRRMSFGGKILPKSQSEEWKRSGRCVRRSPSVEWKSGRSGGLSVSPYKVESEALGVDDFVDLEDEEWKRSVKRSPSVEWKSGKSGGLSVSPYKVESEALGVDDFVDLEDEEWKRSVKRSPSVEWKSGRSGGRSVNPYKVDDFVELEDEEWKRSVKRSPSVEWKSGRSGGRSVSPYKVDSEGLGVDDLVEFNGEEWKCKVSGRERVRSPSVEWKRSGRRSVSPYKVESEDLGEVDDSAGFYGNKLKCGEWKMSERSGRKSEVLGEVNDSAEVLGNKLKCGEWKMSERSGRESEVLGEVDDCVGVWDEPSQSSQSQLQLKLLQLPIQTVTTNSEGQSQSKESQSLQLIGLQSHSIQLQSQQLGSQSSLQSQSSLLQLKSPIIQSQSPQLGSQSSLQSRSQSPSSQLQSPSLQLQSRSQSPSLQLKSPITQSQLPQLGSQSSLQSQSRSQSPLQSQSWSQSPSLQLKSPSFQSQSQQLGSQSSLQSQSRSQSPLLLLQSPQLQSLSLHLPQTVTTQSPSSSRSQSPQLGSQSPLHSQSRSQSPLHSQSRSQSPSLQLKSPIIQSQSQSRSQSPSSQSQSSLQSQSPSQSPTLQLQSPSLQLQSSLQSPSLQSQLQSPSLQSQSPQLGSQLSLQSQSPSVKSQSPQLGSQSSLQSQSPSLQSQSPSFQSQSPTIPSKSPQLGSQSPSSQLQSQSLQLPQTIIT